MKSVLNIVGITACLLIDIDIDIIRTVTCCLTNCGKCCVFEREVIEPSLVNYLTFSSYYS